jgi:hypothetical protein
MLNTHSLWSNSAVRRVLWGIGEASYLVKHNSGSAGKSRRGTKNAAAEGTRGEKRQKPHDWREKQARRREIKAGSQKAQRGKRMN